MLVKAGADFLMPVTVGGVVGTAVDFAHNSFNQVCSTFCKNTVSVIKMFAWQDTELPLYRVMCSLIHPNTKVLH